MFNSIKNMEVTEVVRVERTRINNPNRKDNGVEIFKVFDIATSKHVFTCKVSDSDENIRENVMFELDYDSKELRSKIAEFLISMK